MPDSSQRSNSRVFEELKELSPWEVRVDQRAVDQVTALVALHPALEPFFSEKLLPGLRSFPPDIHYFSSPDMSWGDTVAWVSAISGSLRVRLKVEYRRAECLCWVVEVRAESLV